MVLVLTATAAAVAASRPGGPLQALPVLGFFVVAPGWALVGANVRLAVVERLALSAASGVALELLVAWLMVDAARLSPGPAFAVLGAVTGVVVLAELIRDVRRGRRLGDSE
jgi:hypothetical protein